MKSYTEIVEQNLQDSLGRTELANAFGVIELLRRRERFDSWWREIGAKDRDEIFEEIFFQVATIV